MTSSCSSRAISSSRMERSSGGLELDESILSGESDAVPHEAGDELRSGSFVAEGTGRYAITAVGQESYAERVAGEARSFRHPRSPLERAMYRVRRTRSSR